MGGYFYFILKKKVFNDFTRTDVWITKRVTIYASDKESAIKIVKNSYPSYEIDSVR